MNLDTKYTEIVFTQSNTDWLLTRNEYYEKLGKDTKIKVISDTIYGVSILLEKDETKILIVVNDNVMTGYKGKKLYKSSLQKS